jgi:glutamate-5-semialdehyde dehydrogenase
MSIQAQGVAAKNAARILALATATEKNTAMHAMAQALREHAANIQEANQLDMQAAKAKNISAAFLDRLELNAKRIEAMAQGLESIAALNDPVGTVLAVNQRPNQLQISRVSVPLGVIGVIYESRPNVTADAAGLCLKSGNAVILRGGSESFHSSQGIVKALHAGLAQTHLPLTAIQMLATTDRAAVTEMLKMDNYIDVIIPRGGKQLIEMISAESRIPLFKHLAGLCHTYIHSSANKEMAIEVVLNAKMRRTGICGATEVLLIDEAIVTTHLPDILNALLNAGCEVRAEAQICQLDTRVKLAAAEDFTTEFLDAIIAVKVVTDINAAITHIAEHGTQHTEAIIADDEQTAELFLQAVDSAIVMHNTSTQFADGGEFGMGAEIGIATGKLHARGPVGVEQLTTFKYQVRGAGQVRAL